MRELKVEDALLYLDQVKCEFGDQPHIYNEFLDIMKTFKTQQIDTPGVIRRVSNLFRGNRRLVLGFNTFLPEGYKIELPEGDGPAVAVYRAPGSTHGIVLGPGEEPPQQPSSVQPQPASGAGGSGGWPPPAGVQPMMQGPGALSQPGQAPSGPRPPPGTSQPREGTIGPGGMLHMHGPSPAQQQPPRPGGAVGQQQPQPMGGMKPPPMAQRPPPGGPPMAGAPRPGWPPSYPDQHMQPSSNGVPARGMGYPDAYSGMDPAGTLKAPPPHSQQHGALQPSQQQQHAMQAQQQQQAAAATGGDGQGVVEFDHAINYVTTIKKRFANEPTTYKKFLEILHTYQKEQRGIKEVLEEVSTLFADHPDLLKEFTYFLPDAVQAQAKAQLEIVAKEAEARKRVKARQAITSQAQVMQKQAQVGSVGRGGTPASGPRSSPPDYDRGSAPVPFGASQGRGHDQEAGIIRSAHFGIVSFAPVRPPRRNQLAPTQAAAKRGRPRNIPELPLAPNTTEAAFFKRAKDHLTRKELAADKPIGLKRHTPYTEFLKCLHLYGAGILRKDELFLLLKGLFMQGHAPKSGLNVGGANADPGIALTANELLREFEELMVGRGPYAEQEAMYKRKSKYGGLSSRDFDYGGCEAPTPSYRAYPGDYPHSVFLTHPGQTDDDSQVLNSRYLCVGPENRTERRFRSPEDYDAVRIRHNRYEEEMFAIEDERYEVDMAIERNSQTIRQIEPFAEEVQKLREQEEKDGQPIGRLQYQLNRYAMDTIHVNAIARLYGDKGDEVLQYLLQNPLIALPIIYQRLKQKDKEWREVKKELSHRWNAVYEANYEGSLDVLCPMKRMAFEDRFTKPRLVEDVKRAKTFCLHPSKAAPSNPAFDSFAPTFSMACSDFSSLLFQPHAIVQCTVNASHKDAFHLVSCAMNRSGATRIDRERAGRIWAEFMMPWFDYPAHWLASEVRDSFTGTLSPTVVKFALGQRVVTQFGEGLIQSCSMQGDSATYRVKLPFGTAYLSSSAIMHSVPSKENPLVRRDGSMVRDTVLVESGGASATNKIVLDDKYEMLFGTESVYLFVRLYLLLCSILQDIREHVEAFGTSGDPSLEYRRTISRFPVDAEGHRPRFDYSTFLTAALKFFSTSSLNDDASAATELERVGRVVCKEKVYLIAALPALVDSCVQALLATTREDVLLPLYDYCQYRQSVDPISVRTHCFSIAPSAVYRIQYDTSSGAMYFNYLPRSTDLLVTPPQPLTALAAARTEPEEAGDPVDEFSSEEDDRLEASANGAQSSRPTKRARVG